MCVHLPVAKIRGDPGCTTASVATAVCVPIPTLTQAATEAVIRTNNGTVPSSLLGIVAPAEVALVVILIPVANIVSTICYFKFFAEFVRYTEVVEISTTEYPT